MLHKSILNDGTDTKLIEHGFLLREVAEGSLDLRDEVAGSLLEAKCAKETNAVGTVDHGCGLCESILRTLSRGENRSHRVGVVGGDSLDGGVELLERGLDHAESGSDGILLASDEERSSGDRPRLEGDEKNLEAEHFRRSEDIKIVRERTFDGIQDSEIVGR